MKTTSTVPISEFYRFILLVLFSSNWPKLRDWNSVPAGSVCLFDQPRCVFDYMREMDLRRMMRLRVERFYVIVRVIAD